MPAAARLSDPISCGDTIAEGSGDVFFNGLPVARIGDSSAGHGCFPPTSLTEGSPNVFANNIAIGRVGDRHSAHSCGDSTHPLSQRAITVGSPDVFINGS